MQPPSVTSRTTVVQRRYTYRNLRKRGRSGAAPRYHDIITRRRRATGDFQRSLLSIPLFSRRVASLRQQSDADAYAETEEGWQYPARGRCHPDRRAAGSSGSRDSAKHEKTQALPASARAAAITPPPRGGASGGGSGGIGSGSSSKKRPSRAFHCRKAELLPAVFDCLDSGDWRERVKGLEEVYHLGNNDKIAAGKELAHYRRQPSMQTHSQWATILSSHINIIGRSAG